MNTFSELPKYLSIYKSFIGKRLYLVFVLSSFATFLESIGIMLILPLFEELTSSNSFSNTNSSNSIESNTTLIISSLLNFFNISPNILSILVFIVIFFILKGFLLFAALAYNSFLRGKLLFAIKSELFDAFSSVQFQYFTKRDSGYFANIMNEQPSRSIDAFRNFSLFISQIISLFIYLFFAILVSWQFGITSIFIGIIIIILFKNLNNYVRNLSRKTVSQKSYLLKLIIQTVYGFKYLNSTNRMTNASMPIKESMQRLSQFQIKSAIASSFTQSLKEPIAVILLALLISINILYLESPVAPILVSIIFFYRGINTIVLIQGTWQGCLEYIGSIELINEELGNLKQNKSLYGDKQIRSFKQSISFDKVVFKYDDSSNYQLGPLDINIEANKTIALVGESGSGKSTIIDLINLLVSPIDGQILIDGIDSKIIDKQSWQNKIGFVTQDSLIINDSILNNIIFFNSKEDSEDLDQMNRVIDAAKKAYIHDFIVSLNAGYDTLIGDRGVNLSGGQKQRIFIARELFRKPEILILDEATSALDIESEREVQKSIDSLKGKITIVIIAHRLSTIKKVDYIYIFKNGKILEEGIFSELKNNQSSELFNLIQSQNL